MKQSDTDEQVVRLVEAAETYKKNGMYQSAFDSLMAAYLLDPSSPRVESAERSIVPLLQGQRQSSGSSQTAPMSDSDDARLERLKHQKESERQERERAVWREASSMPRLLTDQEPNPPGELAAPLPPSTGFIAKVRKRLHSRKNHQDPTQEL